MPSTKGADPSHHQVPLTGWRMVGLGLLVLVAWFGLLWPLRPRTTLGLVAELGAGVAVAAYGYLAIVLIGWLYRQNLPRLVHAPLRLLLALSVGVAVFASTYYSRGFIGSNFGYSWH